MLLFIIVYLKCNWSYRIAQSTNQFQTIFKEKRSNTDIREPQIKSISPMMTAPNKNIRYFFSSQHGCQFVTKCVNFVTLWSTL